MVNTHLLTKININNEWYTLPYAIKPILEFLKPNSNILCPFDKSNSEFVKVLHDARHNVVFRHIDDNLDFFKSTI